MKMQLAILVNVLMCFIIYSCSGVPPVDETSGRRTKYTEFEDKLIVEELSNLLDDYTPVYNKDVWKKIVEKHNDKWRAKAPGFPKERTMKGLQNRLKEVLVHNQPYAKVKVPETLMRKIIRANSSRLEQGTAWATDEQVDPSYNPRTKYTESEDMFIVEELSNFLDGHTPVYNLQVWQKIAEKHDEKRKAKTPGFIQERTFKGLQNRFREVLVHNFPNTKVKVPETLLRKIIQTNSHRLDQDAALAPAEQVGQTSGSRSSKYTEFEDKLIVEELSNLLNGSIPVYKTGVWQKIAAKHNEKWQAKTPGFFKERTFKALQNRFRHVLAHNFPHTYVKVPETLLQKINQANLLKFEQGRINQMGYCEKENDLIIEELRKTSSTKLLSFRILDAIRQAHDTKRLAMTKGFENERSIGGLCKHLYNLKQKGRLPEDVLHKFNMHPEETNLPDGTEASSSRTTAEIYRTGSQEISNDNLEDAEMADIFEGIMDDPICNIDINTL